MLCGSARHRPGEYMRERENSATGHIGFLEFINAPALPFARNPCNIDHEHILYSVLHAASTLKCALHPKDPASPTPPTHPRSTISSAGQAAIHSSHRSKPSNRAVPAEHLRAQQGHGISIACGERPHEHASPLTTSEARAPEIPFSGHS